MTQPDYRDQLNIFDPRKFALPVHIIGMGGIGSAVFEMLARLGVPEIHIWDNDVVEPHNLPAQHMYRKSDVDTPKVEAALQWIQRQEFDTLVDPHMEEVVSGTPLDGIVISGVDSMKSRNAIWQCVEYNPLVMLYMDGRIGGEQCELHTLRPNDFEAIERYQSWLFPDEEAAEQECGTRTVIHPPATLAGFVTANLTLFAREREFEELIILHMGTMQFYATGNPVLMVCPTCRKVHEASQPQDLTKELQ